MDMVLGGKSIHLSQVPPSERNDGLRAVDVKARLI